MSSGEAPSSSPQTRPKTQEKPITGRRVARLRQNQQKPFELHLEKCMSMSMLFPLESFSTSLEASNAFNLPMNINYLYIFIEIIHCPIPKFHLSTCLIAPFTTGQLAPFSMPTLPVEPDSSFNTRLAGDKRVLQAASTLLHIQRDPSRRVLPNTFQAMFGSGRPGLVKKSGPDVDEDVSVEEQERKSVRWTAGRERLVVPSSAHTRTPHTPAPPQGTATHIFFPFLWYLAYSSSPQAHQFS